MAKNQTIKAEAFDIMQYLYGAVHNPLIHCLVHFDGFLDEAALKNAVMLSQGALPLIGCCFKPSGYHPCWVKQSFTADDIVTVVDAKTDTEKRQRDALATVIDVTKEPQLKILLLRGTAADTLCVVINHMLCDGAGFKEYLYLLCQLYTNGSSTQKMPGGSRNAAQAYSKFSVPERLQIFFSNYSLSKQKEQAIFRLQGDKDNPIFSVQSIDQNEFSAVRRFAKQRGASVNDMVLTAYARVLRAELKSDRILFPCPVDLRKYLSEDRTHGICNLTSNYLCDVTIHKNDPYETTLAQVSNQMKQQKSNDSCLKPVMMLELAMRFLPFRLMQKVFYQIFTIPVLSYTNLGIMDENRFRFKGTAIKDVYLTGAVKYVPYFQIAVSTYENVCTLSSNLYGTPEDEIHMNQFLVAVKNELISASYSVS